ncbi:MAG: double-strand break repair protein AddB, partial [Pseudomonadota bacterium]
AAVARLPQGALVLPGLDAAADPAIAAAAGDDHPLGPFRRLFASLDLDPRDLRPWTSLDRDRPGRARAHLLAEALRPAPVTDAWVASRETLGTQAPDATQGLALLEAPTQRIEAAAIALAVREALETQGRTVAVVTRDATLARRVGAALARHGILADDSLGQPLALTPAAVLAAHCLAVARGGAAADPVAIAALLGHPLVCLGRSRAAHRRLARAYERAVLRRRGVAARPGPLPGWPNHKAPTDAEDAWLSDTRAALALLTKALAAPAPLSVLVQAHRDALGALTAGEDATPSSPDLDALDRVFERLALAAPAHGGQVQPAEYAALLDGLLRAETLRAEGARPHPRVFLWGTIEARAGAADLTILAGLNEGSWPGVADTGPWLNRPMRRALGLPSPEREIGLSAHDFLQAAARPDVLLTRSTTVEGVPQLA